MHLQRVTQADLPDYARVCCEAMWDDEIMAYTAPFKEQNPGFFYRHCLHRVKIRFYRGEFLFLCVNDKEDPHWTGEKVVMGYCSYSTTVKSVEKPIEKGWLGNAFERFASNCYASYTKLLNLDRSVNPQALAHFRRVLESPIFDSYFESLPDSHKERHRDQHWELQSLGTHPGHRRKGVGKFMLQEGFKRASKDGVPLVLIASVMGEKLYLNAGFQEVKRVKMLRDDVGADAGLRELDLGLGKGKGLTWAAMVWEPESMQDATAIEAIL